MASITPAPGPDDVDAERTALRRLRWPWPPFVLAALLGLGVLGWTVTALPGLPDQVPTHWGLDGRPDAWAEKSFGTVGGGAVVALGMTLLFAFLAALLPAMSPVPATATPWRRIRQAGVVRGSQAGLGWSCLLVSLVLLPTTVEVLADGAWHAPWWLMPLALTALAAGMLPLISASVRVAVRRADAVAADLGHRPTPEELVEEHRWTASGLKRDPDDPSVFPPKREGYGIGTTVNIATPLGRALVGMFVLLFMVGVPVAAWIVSWLHR